MNIAGWFQMRRARFIIAGVSIAFAISGAGALPPGEIVNVDLKFDGPGEVLSFDLLPPDPLEPVLFYTVYRGDLNAPFDSDFSTLIHLRTVLGSLDGTARATIPVNDDNPPQNSYFLVTATNNAGEGTLGYGSDGGWRGGTYGDPPVGEPEHQPMTFLCAPYVGASPPPFPPQGDFEVKPFDFPPLCPEGMAPQPSPYSGHKGMPEAPLAAEALDPTMQGSYYYANTYSWPAVARRDGAGISFIVYSPVIDRRPGTHSLAEMSVQGGPAQGDILEIGWTVDRGLNNDVDPHLFVFHWVGWAPSVYNGGGWVQYNRGIVPGMKLPAGQFSYAGFVYWNGNWWGWWCNQWIGYFPGGLWGGTYAKSSFHQWFGEVFASPTPPNNHMGNGIRGSQVLPPFPAWMGNICEVDAMNWWCWQNYATTPRAPTPQWYDVRLQQDVLNYGGPGR